MRLPLAALEVFAAIARHGSLRAAADALGLKPSTVSHQLRNLEDRLGTALFIRTTRSVSLTEAGRALLRGAGPAFDQLSDAVESARSTGHVARGSLKLALPEFVYHLVLAPELSSFCAKYPRIELELSLTDALSDISAEEMHAGFRLGDRISENMVAVRLTPPQALIVVGSPDYLARNGAPDHPTDLLDHSCIRYRFETSRRIAPWTFHGADGDYLVDVSGPVVVNSIPAATDMALRGMGLHYAFRNYCLDELSDGRLRAVLEDHMTEVPGVYMYFPQEYRRMMPLRLLLEHLRRQK